MLQVYVSSVFLDVHCKCVYLDVTYVSHICCKCFIWMLHMFCNSFSCDVFASVSGACFKCFISLQTYVANVLSGCFKSKLGLAYVAMAPVVGGQRSATRLWL
jgi:hypothetical protein